MRLIVEEQCEEVEFISEDAGDGKKNLHIKGIFLQTEVKNRNGRFYPKGIMVNEVARYNKQYVEDKRAYGELGHPSGPVVNLPLASHRITELKEDGNNFLGKAIIMNTPNGKIVQELQRTGGKFGVSSRGMGTLVAKNGLQEVQKDFKLATAADIVADPSAPDAFVQGVMENVEFWYDDENKQWVAEQIKNAIKKMTVEEVEHQKLFLLNKYIRSMV
jgi:hypothetical protein